MVVVIKGFNQLCNILCGRIKGIAGQYLDIPWERGQYLYIARESGFQLSFDTHFDL